MQCTEECRAYPFPMVVITAPGINRVGTPQANGPPHKTGDSSHRTATAHSILVNAQRSEPMLTYILDSAGPPGRKGSYVGIFAVSYL